MKTASLKIAALLAFASLTAPAIGNAQSWQDRDSSYYDYPIPGRTAYSDYAIQVRAQRVLDNVLGRRADGISVRVNHGVVTLTGRVRNERDRQIARQVVNDVGGVRVVRTRELYSRAYRDRNW